MAVSKPSLSVFAVAHTTGAMLQFLLFRAAQLMKRIGRGPAGCTTDCLSPEASPDRGPGCECLFAPISIDDDFAM